MRKSIVMLISLLPLAGIAHAQQEQPSSAQPQSAVQAPAVPDPSGVDPDTPPMIRDGRDNDESTSAADDVLERKEAKEAKEAKEHDTHQKP